MLNLFRVCFENQYLLIWLNFATWVQVFSLKVNIGAGFINFGSSTQHTNNTVLRTKHTNYVWDWKIIEFLQLNMIFVDYNKISEKLVVNIINPN